MIAEPYYVGKYLKTTLSGSPASLGVTVLVELEMGKNDLKVMSVERERYRGRKREGERKRKTEGGEGEAERDKRLKKRHNLEK